MLTKSIKFSFLIIILILQSCILFESDEQRDIKNSYSCSLNVKINGWNKSVRNCNYTISYSNFPSFRNKGKFQLTMKTPTSTYIVYSKELILEEGDHTIPVVIENCKPQDEIIAICFFTK